eukprot:g56680.t1
MEPTNKIESTAIPQDLEKGALAIVGKPTPDRCGRSKSCSPARLAACLVTLSLLGLLAVVLIHGEVAQSSTGHWSRSALDASSAAYEKAKKGKGSDGKKGPAINFKNVKGKIKRSRGKKFPAPPFVTSKTTATPRPAITTTTTSTTKPAITSTTTSDETSTTTFTITATGTATECGGLNQTCCSPNNCTSPYVCICGTCVASTDGPLGHRRQASAALPG